MFFKVFSCWPLKLLQFIVSCILHIHMYLSIFFVPASDTARGLMTTKALQVSNAGSNGRAPQVLLRCSDFCNQQSLEFQTRFSQSLL